MFTDITLPVNRALRKACYHRSDSKIDLQSRKNNFLDLLRDQASEIHISYSLNDSQFKVCHPQWFEYIKSSRNKNIIRYSKKSMEKELLTNKDLAKYKFIYFDEWESKKSTTIFILFFKEMPKLQDASSILDIMSI